MIQNTVTVVRKHEHRQEGAASPGALYESLWFLEAHDVLLTIKGGKKHPKTESKWKEVSEPSCISNGQHAALRGEG